MRELRTRVEELIAGKRGTTYTIPEGVFVLGAREFSPDSLPRSNVERQVFVTIGNRQLIVPVNNLDNFGLYKYPIKVEVTYLYEPDGSQNEGVGSPYNQSLADIQGAASRQEIEDRALQDQHVIMKTLTWHENHQGNLSPFLNCYNLVEADSTGELEFDQEQRKAKLTLFFIASCVHNFS